MKLLTFKLRATVVLVVCGLLLSVSLHAQNVTLQLKQVKVQQAIEALQKNYGFSVVVKTQDVNLQNTISVDVTDKDVAVVMTDNIFAGQNVAVTVSGKNIAVSKKEAVPQTTVTPKAPATVTVTGKVTDPAGNPVIGAAIYVKTTQKGTVTDFNGEYTLQVPENGQLEFTFLGYDNQTVSVDHRTRIDVTLAESANQIDELVVVGYGVQRKSDLTGSVAQIKMSSLETQQGISLGDYLVGAVAGLNIQRSTSASGQTSFEVRGQTSLGSSVQPRLVVDGMTFHGTMNDINPNDIETLSVLKDASATAVYGADGAGGVIIITTKKGQEEKPTIRFDVKTGVSQLFRQQDVYGVDDYLTMRGDKLITDKVPNYDKSEYFSSPYKLKNIDLTTWMGYDGVNPLSDPTEVWLNRLKLYPDEKTNYYNGKSVNWLDQVFRTGVMQDYNLSVSGKSNNLNYYWSVGMLDNKGIVVNDNYKNIRSRVNITNDVTKFLQVGINANISSANSDGQAADWSSAYDNSPIGTLRNDDGTYARYPNSDNMAKNPLDKTQWDVQDRQLNVIGTLFAKIKLPYGFHLESNFNNHWSTQQKYYYRPSWTIDGLRSNGVAERKEIKQYDWSLENILRWNMTVARDHRFEVTLLQSASKWMNYQTVAGASMFTTSEVLGHHLLDTGEIQSSSSYDEMDTRASYMARLNYSLLDRYLFSFSIRRDGYSAFGQDNPWADFPAAAFAWRISEEPFMKGMREISNLKLRLSYGMTGNSKIGRYDALALLESGNYISNGSSTVTLYPSQMANTGLQWEETMTTNVGLDLGLFNNRLNVTADIYRMKTTNMLVQRGLPTLNGFSEVWANLGQLDNKGIELTVNTVNTKSRNLKWTSDWIFSANRNKIVHLYGNMVDVLDADGNVTGRREADDASKGWYIGHSVDEIYNYKIIGVWQVGEEAQALTQGRVPGDWRTYMLPTSEKLSTADYQWQGFTKPRFRTSLRNTFTFFNSLSLSFMLRAELGHKKAVNEISVGGYADRISQMKFPYWTEENPSNEWARLGAGRTGSIYKNASFLRVENVSLAYDLPKRWLNKAAIQGARIFTNVDNAFIFDSWPYWDPETKKPTPVTFTFGISLTL